MNADHLHSQPYKKVKKQTEALTTDKTVSQQQAQEMIIAIQALKNYTKFISILIRHQQKSLQTLSPQYTDILASLPTFQQLNNRIEKCITLATKNKQFLDQIVDNFLQTYPFLVKLLAATPSNHLHQITPNAILNIFQQIAKEWSDQQKQNRIQKSIEEVVAGCLKYCQAFQRPAIFVQGSGMGRILWQIYRAISEKKQVEYIESCEDRILQNICGEWFTSNWRQNTESKKIEIFPQIHNFTNIYTTSQSYSPTNLSLPQSSAVSEQQVFTNFVNFEQFYRKSAFTNQWNVFISFFCTDRISNVLEWLQIIYKNLQQGGIWINACFSTFEANVIEICYEQFRHILSKSQFQVLQQKSMILNEKVGEKMVHEEVTVHFIVLKK